MQDLLRSEAALLSPTANLIAHDTPIGTDGDYIHSVESGREFKGLTSPIVLCHGYGMGLAAYHLNLPAISAHAHVYAKDWLGCGASSRQPWKVKGTKETEDYFCNSLEEWRVAQGIERMNLVGHSLGGYLSVAYAERYPEKVERLVLVSPVGVPDQPPLENYRKQMSLSQRSFFKVASSLWERGVTPGSVTRFLGPWGEKMIRRYAESRFNFNNPHWKDYVYHQIANKGSGEYALNELLAPFAYARAPLCHRIPTLSQDIPIHFIYGEVDWMDHRHAVKVMEGTKGTKQSIEVVLLPGAGHQLILDEPMAFNKSLLKIVLGKDVDLERFESARSPTPTVSEEGMENQPEATIGASI
ncbi:unnamed protein product [Chrysoparadoxa australica]